MHGVDCRVRAVNVRSLVRVSSDESVQRSVCAAYHSGRRGIYMVNTEATMKTPSSRSRLGFGRGSEACYNEDAVAPSVQRFCDSLGSSTDELSRNVADPIRVVR